MARNLLKAGYPLVVSDVNEVAVNSLVTAGAKAEKYPAGVASRVKCLITMLPSSPHVQLVYTGDNGILKTVQSSTLLIDASTIDPAVSISMSQLAEKVNASFVDAPVSGGVGGAEAGTLTFMVGGSEKSFLDSKVVLAAMGKNIVHCGAVGTGQAAKICNNMLLGISMLGTSEAMNLGVKLGIDPKLLAGILNTSSGRCWSSEVYNPCPGVLPAVPASRGYTGGFGSALMSKDLGLAMGAASAAKASIPLGSLASQIYSIMCSQGFAEKDFSSAYEFLAGQPKK